MTCPSCGNTVEDSGAFCGHCGRALRPAVNDAISDTVVRRESPPALSIGLAPWRGGEVALGILIIAIAITPVILLSAAAGDLAGQHGVAARVWASSHLMGLVILGVVWQLGLKSSKDLSQSRISKMEHPSTGSGRTGARTSPVRGELVEPTFGSVTKGFDANLLGNLLGDLRSLGLNPPTTSLLWSSLLTAGVLAASLTATGLYAALMRWLNFDLLVPPDIPADFAFPGAASAFTFQALAVWTPITEEIFFRGFIFAGLVPRLGNWGAMAASALVFSLFHVDPGVLVPIFITGLLLAWLYRRTGSLWPSIVAHAGQNALALLAAIFVI